MNDPEQSKRAEEAQRNPPDDNTHTKTPDREDVLAGTNSEQAIPVPTQDPTPEVVEEGSNPVARLIRRLRRR